MGFGTNSYLKSTPYNLQHIIHDSNHTMKLINIHKDVKKNKQKWKKNQTKRYGAYKTLSKERNADLC